MIEDFTISPVERCLQPTDVVFVPRGTDLRQGFEYARTLLQHGRSVRIVGSGVTLHQNWPKWVTTEPNMLLTELADRPIEGLLEFLPMRAGIEEWLDTIFADVIRGFRGSQIFYGEAAIRLFMPILEPFTTLANLAKRTGAARYHCVDERWIGLEMLQNLAEQNNGILVTVARHKSVFWPILLFVTGLVAFAGTALDQLRIYVKEAPARAELRRRRSHSCDTIVPHLWVMLVPDWIRINLHVLESVVKPALQRGEQLGVLLSGSLQSGARMDSNLRAHIGSELWPGLGLLQDRSDEYKVDQVISPESTQEFLRVCTKALRQSVRVLNRLACRSSRIRSGALHFDLAKHKWQLAKLVTKDVWTAIAVERASRAAIQRHSFADTNVVLVGASVSSLAVADLILQKASATTVDFAHGSPVTWLSDTPSVSTFKCVWTRADAIPAETFGQSALVAGLPRTVAKNFRHPGYKATNILIASNYATVDSLIGSCLPFLPYQEELLAVVPLIREIWAQRFQFRWRPHPTDMQWAVSATLKQYPNVDLSHGCSLGEDAAWADIIITSSSSVVPQFLLAGVPVFLHVRHSLLHASEVAYFASERKFFLASDLQEPFTQCIAALDSCDPLALDAEKRTRVAFFGSTGEPASLLEILRGGPFGRLSPTPKPPFDSVRLS
jgi:hypothetical protein